MKRIAPLILIVITAWILAPGLPALPQASNEEFIQGTWHIEGYQGQKRRFRWFLKWTFEEGKFNLSGYPPLNQSGSYRVLSDEGDKLTLELYEQQGTFGTKDSRLEIIVNRQKDQLKIRNNEPFLRVKPKS